MSRHGTWYLLALGLLVPPHPITQHASTYDPASLAPIMRAVCHTLCCFLVRKPIVIGARGLMRKVLEAVPLRAGLCVDGDFVVVCDERREGAKVNVRLGKGLAAEAGELYVVEFPVELDALARAYFLRCGFDDRGREKVDGWSWEWWLGLIRNVKQE